MQDVRLIRPAQPRESLGPSPSLLRAGRSTVPPAPPVFAPLAGHGFQQDFAHVPIRHTAPLSIQPKLKVDAADSPLEQEADRVAATVMRMPNPAPQGVLQRKCARCDEEEEKTLSRKAGSGPSVQRKAASAETVPSVPPLVHDVLQSPGQPLDAPSRAFFEPRFGHDFSHVRVHTDAPAAESAQALNARAYTVGNHLAFGRSEFALGTDRGRHLLAHELAHTIQQTGFPGVGHPHVSRMPNPAKGGKVDLSLLTRLRQAADELISGAKNLDPKIYGLGLDLLQFALDIAGVVEPTPIADAINAGISAARGDWWGAGISSLGMIPYIGDFAKAGKLGKYAKTVAEAIELAAKSPQAAKFLGKILETLRDVLASAGKYLPDSLKGQIDVLLAKIDDFFRASKDKVPAPGGAAKGVDEAAEEVAKGADTVSDVGKTAETTSEMGTATKAGETAVDTGKAAKAASAPEKAQDVLKTVRNTNAPPPGYRGGRRFENDGRSGGQVLPRTTTDGKPITYREWDVNPYKPGVNRGPERIVTGSDGRAYYTSDHYRTFTEIQ